MKSVLRLATALIGILFLAGVLLTLGRIDETSKPSANSYGPSGTSALASLLKKRGYSVRIDNRVNPVLDQDETAVLLYLDKIDSDGTERLNASIARHLKSGGTALLGVLITKFEAGTPNVETVQVYRESGEELTISQSNVAVEAIPNWKGESEDGWYSDADVPITTNWTHGPGASVVASDALFMTNRHLDEQDNARFAVNLIDSVAASKKVVFLAAAYGDGVDEGLIGAIAPAARYLWLQILFLVLVVAVTLGRRFGLPVLDKSTQTGQRQLVDAISYLMRRSDGKPFVATTLLKSADRRIRKVLKMPGDAPVEHRNRELPESLQKALYLVERAGELRAPDDNFLAVTQTLERELDAFSQSRSIIRNS
ncbi:MAG: DUF4350 domain-containing protein [Fimbriimonadaceae bacterium]